MRAKPARLNYGLGSIQLPKLCHCWLRRRGIKKIVYCTNFRLPNKFWRGPHNDALVLMVNIYNMMLRELIDPGSSSEVIYLNTYNQLRRFIPRKNVRTIDAPIYSFSGEPVWPICIVDVSVRIGEVTTNTEFFLSISTLFTIRF